MTHKQRMEITQKEIEAAYGRNLKPQQGELVWVDAEFNTDPDSPFNFSVTRFKLPTAKVLIKKWIYDNGFVICKAKEATCLLTVGAKEHGLFVATRFKNYWLKPA